MSLDRFDWLSQVEEEAFDPLRRIVDAHHHLWDRGGSTFLVEQLLDLTSATHNITDTVFVECMAEYRAGGPAHLRPVGETEFVAAEAARAAELGGSRIAAIVGFADLTLGPAVEEVLAAHEQVGHGLFRGIRHATGKVADDAIHPSHTKPRLGLMAEPAFREGFATLGTMGYSFDAWLYHPQLGELVELARDHPDVPIVLDHLGAPMGVGPYAGRRDEVLEEWRASMDRVAACDSVVLKLGGIGMDRYYGMGWAGRDAPPTSDEVAGHWGDVVRWCIDRFGPSRCMFESNFPVDRETLPYPVLWNALQKIAAGYDDEEQDLLFSGTASRVYRLAEER